MAVQSREDIYVIGKTNYTLDCLSAIIYIYIAQCLFQIKIYLSKCHLFRCGINTTAALAIKHKYNDESIDWKQKSLKPQRLFKSGGRDSVTGRAVYRRVGGGHKQCLRIVSFDYNVPENQTDVGHERVIQVRYDPLRTADIAVAATGNRKRYILASDGMQKGDLIKTFANIPDFPVSAEKGNQYPVGSLPIGTIVHNIERWPKAGGRVARAAGTSGVVTRKLEDNSVVISMPSKREMRVDQYAMATVGRVSNPDHQDEIIGKAGRNRWKGIRPSSGFKQKKTGYHGKKIKKPKAAKSYIKIQAPTSTTFKEISD
ncbi:large ribosomal subunit protein uL2m-like [Argopecten irradians]|uniref:large ribosomal subunit protein uL2m-like n=1 Tax=Argopecten irradians TaxID=31199 RepID=UPI00371F2480